MVFQNDKGDDSAGIGSDIAPMQEILNSTKAKAKDKHQGPKWHT